MKPAFSAVASRRRPEGMGAALKTLFLVLAASLAMAGFAAGPAMAQLDPPPPPKYEAVDANGVDLLSGKISIGSQPVNSIGDGAGGLTASEVVRYGTPLSSQYSYVKLTRTPDFFFSTTVVLLGATETFEGMPDIGATPDSYTSGEIHIEGNEFVYTQKNGTVARFGKVILGTSGPPTRIGYLKSVTYPSGEKLTVDFVYGVNMLFESSLGYAMTGSIGSRWSPVAANLKSGGCSGATCSGPAFDNMAAQGRALTTSISGSTLSVTSPAGGATRTYVLNSDSRVTSFSNGAGTWTYAYGIVNDAFAPVDGILTTTATDPLGHTRVVKTRMSTQHILSDTNGVGKTTTFQYSLDATMRPGLGLLTQISWPEGNRDRYEYDGSYNVTAKWSLPKGTPIDADPNTVPGATVVRAAYGGTCATSKVCDKPDWVRDARGNQTDFTYDPVHGGVLTVTQPAPAAGAVRPQTRYTYGQFTAMYVRGGVLQAAAAPVWRLTQTSTCSTGAAPACLGTADETVISYAYEPSNVANNVRLLSTTTRAGDNSLSTTASYAYNDRGDITAVDGPLPGTADTTRTYYDASRWTIGQVGPDPDGAGPLLYRAGRTTYAADGQATSVEAGTATNQSDTALSTFSSLQATLSWYDPQRRKNGTGLAVGGALQTFTQVGYDLASRPICQTVRMNPAAFGSAPGACTLGTPGTDGPDRITYTNYDPANRVTQVTSGYLSAAPRVEKSVTYTDNGKEATTADGKGNLTTYEYDGLDRLAKVRYPNPTCCASSDTDFDAYGYDAANNRTSWQHRPNPGGTGLVAYYDYDALNREIYRDGAPHWTYYDNLGRPTVTYSGTWGEEVSVRYYDALGRTVSDYGYFGGVWKPIGSIYDVAGRRTHVVWDDGFFVQYVYDNAGEVTGILENGATQLAGYAYDNLGRRTLATLGNGATTTYGYDAASRLNLLDLNLAGTDKDQHWTFGYTAASQVKTRSASNALYEWSAASTPRGYTINGLNQVTVSGGLGLAYDGRGNMTNDTQATYSYDLDNQLTNQSTPAGTGVFQVYDPLGRLHQIQPTVGASTWLAYDGANLVTEYDLSRNVLRRYVPGPGTDEPVVWYEGSGTSDRRWLQADPQGSIVAVTNGAGAALAINTYDEYGVPAAGNLGRYQYTGQTWIAELGLYNYKARFYSPTLGRFLQTDPIGYGDGLNWYAYTGNDPVNGSDPTGTQITSASFDSDPYSSVYYAPGTFSGGSTPAVTQVSNPGNSSNSSSASQVPNTALDTLGEIQDKGLKGYLQDKFLSALQYQSAGYVKVYRLWGEPASLYGGPNCEGGGSCWSTDNMASASNYNIDVARDRYSVFPQWNSFTNMAEGWVSKQYILYSGPVQPIAPYSGGGNETSIKDAAQNIVGVTSNKVGWCRRLPFC